jgi:hypothetical protein
VEWGVRFWRQSCVSSCIVKGVVPKKEVVFIEGELLIGESQVLALIPKREGVVD